MKLLSNIDMDRALIHCIGSKTRICITRKNKDDWQVYKSCIKSGSFGCGISVGEQLLTYGQEGNPSGKVGISFREKNHKLLFHTTLQNNSLTWPTKMLKLSRRVYQRQSPTESIAVRFWSPGKSQHYSKLEDISIGGMKVSTEKQDYRTGPYVCVIDHPRFSVLTNAILRKTETQDEKRTRLAFQFVGLEFNPQTITKLVEITLKMTKKYTRAAKPWALPWQN